MLKLREKGPNCTNTREAERIQEVKASFNKQNLNDTKKTQSGNEKTLNNM